MRLKNRVNIFVALFFVILSLSLVSAVYGSVTGNIVGNVSFSVAQINEINVTNETLVVPSTGAGGAGAVMIDSFDVSKRLVSLVLTQGIGDSVYFNLTNKINSELELNLNLTGLDGLSVLFDKSVLLVARDNKEVKLDFFAPTTIKPGVYVGKLIIDGEGVRKSINLVVEVKERNALFDIKIDLFDKYKAIFAGEKVYSRIDLSNIGLRGQPVDVALRIYILDFDKNVVYESKEEMIAVSNDMSINRSIIVPFDLISGDYVLLVRISYENAVAESFDTFSVINGWGGRFFEIGFWVLVVVLLIVTIYILVKRRNKFDEGKGNYESVDRIVSL
jgi:uncharacterized membrane protein